MRAAAKCASLGAMMLGTVVRSVWGTVRSRGLAGEKLLIVRSAAGEVLVAVDRLGAGPGERVLVGFGSRVRDLTLGGAVPTKAVVLGIVDGSSR